MNNHPRNRRRSPAMLGVVRIFGAMVHWMVAMALRGLMMPRLVPM